MLRKACESTPKKRKKSEDGFSLTEVLVAIFIIGLVSVVALGPVLNALSKGNVAGVKKEFGILETALTQYYLDMGEYPSTQDGLEALYTLPSGSEKADRYPTNGFLQKRGFLTDPWGNAYEYKYPGEHSKFDIISLGADGREGGEDENADIGNWQD